MNYFRTSFGCLVLLILIISMLTEVTLALDLQDEVVRALELAVKFYRTRIASRGGYLKKYQEDPAERWAGRLKPSHIDVQPPGTPAVGLIYLRAYEVTGDERYLEAAIAAANALVWGQLVPGGWFDEIHFLEEETWRYRHEAVDDPSDHQRCTFDDDKSQSAIRLLMAMDNLLDCDPYSEAALYGLEFVLQSQFPNGAWSQRYPLSGDYSDYYTFNDASINDCIDLMVRAYEKYGDKRYLESAERGADFIMLSQIDLPQPGWAQQYYWNLSPAWARDFEPPAVCSTVTKRNIMTLLDMYLYTGNSTYLEPIPAAIEWLNNSKIGENLWARFYELGTNTPIYCDRGRKLTYNVSDLREKRTTYGWQGAYGLSAIQMYDEVMSKGREQYVAERDRELTDTEKLQKAVGMEAEIRGIIDALDDRGRWVDGDLISSGTFNRNVGLILTYLEYSGWNAVAPPIPEVYSFSVAPSGLVGEEGIVLTANVTHPSGTEKISNVILGFTPLILGVDWMAMRDDGKGGDATARDGSSTLLFKPTDEMSPDVYQGLVVVEDEDGHWNLATIPLGPIANVGTSLRGLLDDLARAALLGADISSVDTTFTSIDLVFPNQSAGDLETITAHLTNVSRELELRGVAKLIELATDAVDRAKEMGIDTSRYEIFLRRANEELAKGNYGSARQFTNYPLGLWESIGESFSLLVLPSFLGIVLLRLRWRREGLR